MWKAGSIFLITAAVLSRLVALRYSAATMPSSDSDPLDHSELISVLTELYTLLDTLSAIPPLCANLPPFDTGVWPSDDFDAEAARAAGFSEDAVRVLSMIPSPAYEQELEQRTTALSFLGETDWDRHRVLVYGLDEFDAPPSAIKLTDGGEGDGCVYVYDVETRLMHPWFSLFSTAVDDPEERDMRLDYFRAYVPSMSPREALQPFINKFRRLEYINHPPWAGTEHKLVYDSSYSSPPLRDGNGICDERNPELERYEEWLALRQFKEIYLECGWDVDAVVQTGFRQGEFLEKRGRHLDEVYKDRLAEIMRRREL